MPKSDTPIRSQDDDLLSSDGAAASLGNAGLAAYYWTPEDDVLRWSTSLERLLGVDDLEALHSGGGYESLVASDSGSSRCRALKDSIPFDLNPADRDRPCCFETRYCLALPADAEGRLRRVWLEDRGFCHFDLEGQLLHVEGFVRLLPEPAGEELSVDPDLASGTDRQRLSGLIEGRLEQAGRDGSAFAFILIGIDYLGDLNDTYGFLVADEVIEVIWQRLKVQLEADDELARFSGSKFGLLVADGPDRDVKLRVKRLLDAVNASPPRTSVGAVAASITAGGVLIPQDGAGVSEIFAHAQDALQRARRTARGAMVVYSPQLDRAAERSDNVRFADEIVRALEEGRVSLAFQPIARTTSHEVVLHECLVRIVGEGGHIFDGASVIPAADRYGLTRLLDCRTLELTFDTLRANPALVLSVNASPATLYDVGWIEEFGRGSKEGLTTRLIVEITESAGIHDVEAMRDRVAWLHALGSRVAMDDFGVGYTSFRNLRSLGVDMLKIDGSFISAMMQSPDDRHFVETLLSLADRLGIETVAEWVLDKETAVQLAKWGCTYLQGEFIGLAEERPLI